MEKKITTNNKDLFICLNNIFPQPQLVDFRNVLVQYSKQDFIELIDNIIPDLQEFMYQYISKSGNKKLSSLVKNMIELFGIKKYNDYYSIEETTIKTIFSLLQGRFKDKWKKLYETLSLEYNPIKPFSVQFTDDSTDTMETTTKNTSRSNSNNNSSIYAFNSSSNVPTDVNSTVDDDSSSSDYRRSNPYHRETERVGNIGNIPQQDLINKERELLNYQIWDTIFNDLDRVFTRSKYI